MSAAMLAPAAGALALIATGALTDLGDLMIIEHVAMLAAMLGAMLVRRDEYTSHHGAHAEVTA
jgi:hypothetical protein